MAEKLDWLMLLLFEYLDKQVSLPVGHSWER